jgi:hypothetical protein
MLDMRGSDGTCHPGSGGGGTPSDNESHQREGVLMGLLDRLLGRPQPAGSPPARPEAGGAGAPADSDEAAIARYRYLLRTAPPEKIEQAHAEAFARLTPEQRRQVLDGLAAELPESERARDADPQSLARMATRAEMRNPGTLERSFGGSRGMGMGMGGMIAGSLLASVAGAFVGTAIATELFDGDTGDGGEAGAGEASGTEAGDAGGDAQAADTGGDFGGGDFGGF